MYKKIFFYFFLIWTFSTNLSSNENKILVKINNEIITYIDVVNEENYLKSINPKIKNFNEKELFEISLNSAIREKIRELEISKYLDKLEIDNDNFEKLLSSSYTKLGINTKKDFKNYIESFGLSLSFIRKKITIEALWSQFIYQKFITKVKIDENQLRKIVLNNKNSNSYFLHEIIFQIKEGEKLAEKYEFLKKQINENGFEKTALQYSVSQSSKNGGEIGWIESNSLNSEIKKLVENLKKDEVSKPITIPGGFLILKVLDAKDIELDIDVDKEVIKLIKIKTNEQLDNYSNMYFNKVKKGMNIVSY